MSVWKKFKAVLGFEFGDDEPMPEWCRKLDRRWRWVLGAAHWNHRVAVGMDLLLTQFEGKRDPDPTVVQSANLLFIYDPREWKVGQDHMYYDGPHCLYQFGPFALSWELDRDCHKCMPDGDS